MKRIISVQIIIFLLVVFCDFFCGFVSSGEVGNLLLRESFDNDLNELYGWNAERSARVYLHDRVMRVDAVHQKSANAAHTESEPIISKHYGIAGNQMRLVLEVRTLSPSDLVINWTTKEAPTRDDAKKIVHKLNPDGNWQTIGFFLPIEDMLDTISLRFTHTSGTWGIRSINLYGNRTNPIAIRKITPFKHKNDDGTERDMLRYTIKNNAPYTLKFHVEQPNNINLPVTLSRNQTIDLGVPITPSNNLNAVKLSLIPDEQNKKEWIQNTTFPVFIYNPKPDTNWIQTKLANFTLEIDPNARIARIKNKNEVTAIIAPIVHRNGIIPQFTLKNPKSNNPKPTTNSNVLPASNITTESNEDKSANTTEFFFESTDCDLWIDVVGDEIKFRVVDKLSAGKSNTPPNDSDISATQNTFPLESPVVRLFGKMQSGLLPGVEFLGEGDVSSSQIDIKSPYNYRGKPNHFWLTMPMAILGTDKISAMLSWKDTKLQPTFHSPNTIDYTDDHRVSLVGNSIEATLKIFPPSNFPSNESAIISGLRAYIKEHKLPTPPNPPRQSNEQFNLCLKGIRGAIQSPDGAAWGYATDAAWERKPYADMFSVIARITGKTPPIKEITSGGADVANDTIYFLTENIDNWKREREESIRSILTLRNPDGSYLFRTRFSDVESAATSFGLTAMRTLELMEYVRLTGDKRRFELVRDSLDFLLRCDVPRGGFYQDSPLHTPDLLTVSALTWLFAWAYEYTGERRYLDAANRFAFYGLPFVYQWTNRDIMLYTTIPKFGGSSRGVPLWFGVSQPRVGVVYAYALTILAEHDKSVEWQKIATGILHATEKMQYTNSANIGCIPDTFEIESQHAGVIGINPVGAAMLRLRLEGKPNALYVLVDNGYRYASPFPLKLTKRGIEAVGVPQDQKFQILCNGIRIIDAKGSGLIMTD